MSKKRQPKTEGYTWLEHSFIAFNGSGYGDRSTPKAFVDSYIDYNKWKKRPHAVKLATEFYVPLLTLAKALITYSDGPGKTVSDKNMQKFEKFKNS